MEGVERTIEYFREELKYSNISNSSQMVIGVAHDSERNDYIDD